MFNNQSRAAANYFAGRRKPVPGGLAVAVQATNTREIAILTSSLQKKLRSKGNQIDYLFSILQEDATLFISDITRPLYFSPDTISLLYPSIISLKKFIVFTNPSSSLIFGSHPKTSFARVISGRRCTGSSQGSSK